MQDKFTKIIILLFIVISNCFIAAGQNNSVRIAIFQGDLPIPDNFLERAHVAGYTHVQALIGDFDATQWSNGEYIGATAGMIDRITEAFQKCNSHGLRYIPALPSANRYGTTWYKVNNPAITYQLYVQDIVGNNVLSDVIDNDLLLRVVNKLAGKSLSGATKEWKLSHIPAYAPNPDGYDKTYRSLIEQVIARAFRLSGLPANTFDYIHLGYDEPNTYNGAVEYEFKLLIGKNQEDLKWIYNNDTINHNGVGCVALADTLLLPDTLDLSDSTTLNAYYAYKKALVGKDFLDVYTALTDSIGRRAGFFNDTVYFLGDYNDSLFNRGVQALLAEHCRRRVQDVVDFIPNVKCIFNGDLFDPEHLGSYFKTAGALEILADDSIVASGVQVPVSSRTVFMPWCYSNTFTHELEGQVDSASVQNGITQTVLKLTAEYLACSVLFPPGSGFTMRLLRRACQATATKYEYNSLTNANKFNIYLTYKSTGRRYELDTTLQYFMSNNFPVVYVNAIEYEMLSSHTLAQMVKVMDSPAHFTQAQRDSFLLGVAAVTWVDLWNDTNSMYKQDFSFNNLEILASNFDWHNIPGTSMLFGDIRRGSAPLNVFWSRNPVSVIDYFATTKDLFNGYLIDSANAFRRAVNFYDAVQFCNNLSIRDGLTPVYTLSNIRYNSIWNTASLDTIRHEYDVRGPRIISAVVTASLAQTGYRLPTANEILRFKTDASFRNVPSIAEWIWRGDSLPPLLYSPTTGDTVTPVSTNRGCTFRVVRRNLGLPKISVLTLDEGLTETNISKPRMYIQNGSSIQLSKFTVHYYFTVDSGKIPVLEQYWAPGSNLGLNAINDSTYEIQYYFNGTLDTGNTVLPVLDGNVVGLHYVDWSTWNKSNDYSFNNSSTFIKNEKVVITDSTGFVLYGELPFENNTPPDTAVAPQPIISVFSRDEALSEGNMSKPRIFIQNTGAGLLSDFTVHYYFTAENGKTPIVDQYWVPGSTVTLYQINDSLYEIQYHFSGELGIAGAILPEMSGNVVGIHYDDWSVINKTNDFSFPNSSTFVRNANIAVTNSAGVLIYGNMP